MIYALVVEDEEDIRNLLAELLADKGCSVRRADNGSVALRLISKRMPDIIFVDIMMPVMDGIEFISRLQENPETAGIPVVLVTGVSTPAVTMKAVGLGVRFRLAKPWEQSEFDFVFEQSLEHKTGELDIPAARR